MYTLLNEGARPTSWTPALEARAVYHGWEIRVVSPGETFTRADLGSSPGDALYDGKAFVFESHCPLRWVYHEIAHWYDTAARGPKKWLTLPNYGFDRPHDERGSDAHSRRASEQERESRAAVWTVGLMTFDGCDADWVQEAYVALFSADKNAPPPKKLVAMTRRYFKTKPWPMEGVRLLGATPCP